MKKKFSKILGVGLALVLALSLVLIAAPVAAQFTASLVKTLTDDEGEVDATNPMSGIVKFEFVYDGTLGAPDWGRIVFTMSGPAPYTVLPMGANFFHDGSWAAGAEAALLEMGFVDWNENGKLDREKDGVLMSGDVAPADIIWTVNTPPAESTLTFWIDITKNWSRDTDDLGLPWHRSAHT